MNECKCSKEREIAILETDVKSLFGIAASNKTAIADMSKIYDLIYGLTTNVSLLTEQMARNTDDLGTVKKGLEKLESKPGNDYEHYKRSVVVFIITAILGFIVGKMF